MSQMQRALDEAEERLERLRWMHPFADDDEIERWKPDPSNFGPVSLVFAGAPLEDLGAGIKVNPVRS